MKVAAIIAFLTLLPTLHVNSRAYSIDSPLQEVIRKVSLKKNGIVVIAFVTPGECTKCNIALSSSFAWMKEKMPNRQIKFAGFVTCQREIELKQHIPKFPMFDLLLMNDGDIQKRLKIPLTSRAVVCDHEGNLLGVVSYEEYFGNIQAAFARILKMK